MKTAVYYGPRDVRLEESEVPEIADKEILVKIHACGVCGTDIKTVMRGHPLIKPPTVLGHEIAGEIVKMGKDVMEHKIGERVVVAPYVPDGTCYYCLHGRYTMCSGLYDQTPTPGGFAEFVKVPDNIVKKGTLEIPGTVSYEEASLTEPLACCLHGIEECHVGVGDSIAIVGDGPIGLMHLQLAKVKGATKTILSGQLNERLKLAEELGADVTVNETEEKPVEKVMEETDNRGADAVIVAVGSVAAAEEGLKMVRKGGIINFFGGFPSQSELKLDPNLIHYSEVTITGTFGFSHITFANALQLIGIKRVNVDKLITHKFRLNQVLTAIDVLAERKGLKAVVTISAR
ncbi:MAG: zinc-dependent dehydrogenase [Candidatus Bathyarchaeia archaeon]